MVTIKGFGANVNMSNNNLDVVSAIGEISADSLTYSKDRGIYYKDELDAIVLTTFLTKKDGNYISLKPDESSYILNIIKWTYDKVFAKGTEVYAHELLDDLITQFASTSENFKSGAIVHDTVNNVWMPEWLSWNKKGSEETYIRIWFSDVSFQKTYDEYEIVVVPPIKNIDDFFKVSAKVSSLLDERDLVKRTEDIQLAKEDKPETIIRTEMFNYIDPLKATNKLPTYWDLLIYGEAGNNIDSIKDAIIDYILKNTKRTREEWTKLFPDIFKRTEFIILPNWTSYAIPNRITEYGVYNPILNIKDAHTAFEGYATLVPEVHLRNHIQAWTHPYKSIVLRSISSQENRDNLFKITDVYPDYIAQSSTSQDFNRQVENTREWAEKLANMLVIAEEATQYSDIPRGYTKLMREGKLFIVMSYKNIHYLVVAKSNF